MSVILDALKKLDREKSYRGDGTPNIAAEILRPDPPKPVKRIRLYFLVVALIVVTTLAVTYAVMVEFGFLKRFSPSVPVPPPSSSQRIPPELRTESSSGTVSSPAEPQQVVPAPVSRESVRDVREKENQMHSKIEVLVEDKTSVETKTPAEIKPPLEPKPPVEAKTAVEIKPPAQPNPAETRTSVASPDEKKAATREKAEALSESVSKTASPNVSSTTPPSLKLSAIVWYENPSMRFAFVNGVKATEGSEVEGVKVVEINRTSVRFLHNGRYFELSMTP